MRTNSPTSRGRPFAKGNPGRPPGSKNRTTAVAEALLQGEAESLLRTAVNRAKGGDVTMLKFLLSRILPRERSIEIELPHMDSADDAVETLARIMTEVSEGRVTPSEGAALAALTRSYRESIDLADLVRRLDALERFIIDGSPRR